MHAALGTDLSHPDAPPCPGAASFVGPRQVDRQTVHDSLVFVWCGATVLLMPFVGDRNVPLLLVTLAGAICAANLVEPLSRRRAEVASAGILAAVIAVPITRVPYSGRLLLAMSATMALMAASGLVPAPHRKLPASTALVVSFGLLSTVVTSLSPDSRPLLHFAPFAAASIPVFLLATQLSHEGARKVSGYIVGFALLEAVVAALEPWLLPSHPWSIGAGDDLTKISDENGLLGGALQRSYGTVGHPLLLGLLLVSAVALLVSTLRSLDRSLKCAAIVVLLAGLVFAGSRNSIVIALVLLIVFPRSKWYFVKRVSALLVTGVVILGAVGLQALTASTLSSLVASGSFTHRLGAYTSVPGLLDGRNLFSSLLGDGYSSTGRLIGQGYLQQDGFGGVDSQPVSTLVQTGLIGIAVLIVVCIRAAMNQDEDTRPLYLVVLISGFIFDIFAWPLATFLFFFAVGISLSIRGQVSDRDQR